jgi:16S rRNA processing protein RimM
MPDTDRDILIGKIVAPFGVRGHVKVIVLTDFPERFDASKRITLALPNGERREATIEESRPHKDGIVAKLDCAATMEEAEELRGAEIVIDRSEVGELAPDAFYVFDVLGLQVRTDDGRDLGEVAEVISGGANDVYVTSTGICIPALKSVVTRVDLAEGVMVVHPVPGLIPED